MCDLFDVVHQAIQEPLDIHFHLSSEGKAIQALVGPDIGKNWLSHREALWVDLSPQVAINLAGHPPGKVGEFYSDGHPEIPLFAASSGQTPERQRTARTIVLLGHLYSVHQTIWVDFFGYPPESFALGALVVIGGLLVRKIL